MVDLSTTPFLLYNTPYGVYYCIMWQHRFREGDVIRIQGGLATVLSSRWVTLCDGWHPDKRRTEEELKIMTDSGLIQQVLAIQVEGPIIQGADP